ncbi:hypothetical protein Ocin01_11753 [Orchesella cincta]|uniref:Uncharacterized protein n=1 Tax=Orchesella cincta TaxID=48709 RepID=A0A1D2MPU6_ORCCI|nr:hypothetical protein Ocin01_11753 [Orchesella cincta]
MTSSCETLNTKQLSRIGSSNSSGGGGRGSSIRTSPTCHHHHPSTRTMTERWFLCSQTARTEARLLAILDLISSIVYLIMFGLLTFAIIHHPELVRKYLDEVPENQDIARLLTYGTAKQAFFLSILILRPATSLIIAFMLFVGAQKRSFGIVRICFFVSIIYITVDMILFIPKTIYTQNGKIYVITYIFNVIYMLYELWVMYELKKEVQEYRDKEKEDAEPETEDTTVVGEGESAGTGEDGE